MAKKDDLQRRPGNMTDKREPKHDAFFMHPKNENSYIPNSISNQAASQTKITKTHDKHGQHM